MSTATDSAELGTTRSTLLLHYLHPLKSRLEIISSLKFVDEVFVEDSLDLKAEYITSHNADILVMGDDWEGRFDHLKKYCDVVYLPRTPSISTTEVIEIIKEKA